MEYIYLNNSDIKVSRICIGGDQFGGYGWGKADFNEYECVISEALERGINFFDTADIYGLGKSEEFLGKCLKQRRSEVVIESKFGVRIENGRTFYDNSPYWIEQCMMNSLKRLKTDYIDIYYVHYWDGTTPIEIIVNELEKYKEKGYIRAFGISNFDKNLIDRIDSEAIAGAQYEFSLARRVNEDVISYAEKKLNVNTMTWGSLGRGVLTGKYKDLSLLDSNDKRSRELDYNFHGDTYKKNLNIVRCLEKIASTYKKTLSAVAIRFILDYLDKSIAIVGMKRREQLYQNLESLNWHLLVNEINELDAISK